jgi:tetratricopeptide (TPR) repeat protein
MNPTVRVASAAIAAILAFAALTSNASIAPAFADEVHTDFVTNAEYIKGHLAKAVENKQAGNIELTIAHSGHPIEEVFTLMEGPLSEESPQRAADLKAALEALPNTASSDSLQAFTDKVTEINGMLDEAVTVFAGDEATELGSVVIIISNLLETAELEYGEGVAGGEVVEMIEYQDASAFIARANSLFTDIQDSIEAQEEAEEIEQFFGQLVSGVNARADPEDVSTLIEGIIHEFEEAVPSAGSENVAFAANIEFIKGHLTKAIENKQAGNTSRAIAHSGHPIEEVYTLVEGEITEHNATLNTDLKAALSELANQVEELSATDFQSQVAEVNAMLDDALDSVIGQSEQSDPKFNAQVAISLMEIAEVEYEEAVSEGVIVEMIEYQDSTAFIERAELIFDEIKAELPAHEAEELEEFFGQLTTLTESNASFEDVETVIGGIIHEFEEAVGLEGEEEEELDGWGYIDGIKELLDQAVTEYKAGNAQRAKALAIEAYLDNYEFIESDIEQDDEALMLKIEEDMRVELVQMIDQQAPSSAIESHVQAIKVDLEQARTVVVPEFPALIAIVAAAMAMIIGLGKTGRRRLGSGPL